jgi:UDPglucose--hexose-1-phosphate uridylyltransferase
LSYSDHPHRRFNPLRGEWVLVSPRRNDRPWQGQIEPATPEAIPPYDPGCYLCPGNIRAGGAITPPYASAFVFDNDYPALLPSTPLAVDPPLDTDGGLLLAVPARGLCRVVCFSPRHDLTLARMDVPSIRAVVETWIVECASVAAQPWAQYALVFENRGAMMGASNPHPHGQIWATDHLPNEAVRERSSLERYSREQGTCLLCDYLEREMSHGDRIVCANEAFAVVVPFWATWPFETLLVSRRHVGTLAALGDGERDALGDILKRVTTRFDNLFETPFPYSMGFHQQPLRDASGPEHLHGHFYPPLLRSASIRKFMVGFELLGSPQRDLTPEEAARRLREAGEIHYAKRAGAGAPG